MSEHVISELMRRGVEYHRAGRVGEAERIYREVLAGAPDHADALHLLGVVAMNSGNLGAAIQLIGRAAGLHPGVTDYQYNLGVALMGAGRVAEAAEAFSRVVGMQPDQFAARCNLAAALMSLRRFDEAAEASRVAVTLNPNHADSWNNYGVALKEMGRLDEAIAAFERAVAIRPDLPEALTNLGNAFQRARRIPEAIAMHRRAIGVRSDVAELHNNLGSALYDDLQYEEAIAAYKRALELRPDYREAQSSLANAYYRLARLDEAIAAARRAIQLWPDSPLPKFNLGLMLLSKGEFEEGWRMNEARWDVQALSGRPRDFGKPMWGGGSGSSGLTAGGSGLAGRTILLYGEQGFGDTIQFIRYIPRVREMGARIILGCQSELVRLLKQVEGVGQIVTRADASLGFDVHCPLMTLPMIFGTNLQNIPSRESYLAPDPQWVGKWGERIPSEQGIFRVGIAWAGRPTHDNDRNRSLTLSMLAPLAQAKNVLFVSLQKGEAAAQAQNPPPGMRIVDLSYDVQDFADTAGIIANLDLVITVDTAAAHLAAAMGKATWVLLPFAPDWRWMLGREDSPWYPSIRLYRQDRPRDWSTPIQRAAAALAGVAGGGPHA